MGTGKRRYIFNSKENSVGGKGYLNGRNMVSAWLKDRKGITQEINI
jgi:hypothetical protein